MTISDGECDKTYYDLQCKNIARCCFPPIPVKYAFVVDFNQRMLRDHRLPLNEGKLGALFNYVVLSSIIHIRLISLEVVEDVDAQGAVSCPEFVDDQVFVGKVLGFVLCRQTISNGLSIIRL